jgi:competence protein ComEC
MAFGAAAWAAMTGWVAGLAWQFQQPSLGPPPAAAAIALAGLLAWGVAAGLARRWSRRAGAHGDPTGRAGLGRSRGPVLVLLIACGAAALAFGSTEWRAHERLQHRLDPALEGRDLRITGVVAGLPQRTASGLRFEFAVERAAWGGETVTVPPRLLLSWTSGFHEDATLSQPQRALRAGQRWELQVRLRRPHGPVNPGGFDLERHLFERGLGATGAVRDAPPQVVDVAAGHPVLRARQAMRDAIERQVGDTRDAGVLAALALGDQSAIARDDWDLFRITGVAHLMAISGLHVTMFAWLVGGLVAWAWRASPRLCMAVPAPHAALVLGAAAAALYAVFSGWAVPAQRTVWMLLTVTLLALSGRRWPWPLVLATAAAVVLAVDPWALLDAGFWLSFGAVGLLLASSPWVGARPDGGAAWSRAASAAAAEAPPAGRWRGQAVAAARAAWHTQVVATLGLAPLTLLLFQQVSVVGFVANLVAVPWVTMVVTPLALLGALWAPLWSLAAAAVDLLGRGLELVAQVPGAVFEAPVASTWIVAAALFGGLLVVLPLPWRWRVLAVPLIAPLLVPPVARPAPGAFEVVALDVGQGTAVLVRTHRHLLVYDAGPRFSRDSDAGERLVLPALRARGERRIDRLLLSHRDLDHVGGAASLLREREVGDLMSSLEPGHPLLALAAERGVATAPCRAGEGWQWDGVQFEMLHPDGATLDAATRPDVRLNVRPNARSCVLRVRSGADPSAPSVLLTGDIELEQEIGLVARHGDALASQVLIVPHHGSRTSSSPAFLDAVAPRWAVVQAGYQSRFGHPDPRVLERYAERGIPVAASPACGAWQWASDDLGFRCWREVRRRYWHHPGPPLER